jgi:hypothetical protein
MKKQIFWSLLMSILLAVSFSGMSVLAADGDYETDIIPDTEVTGIEIVTADGSPADQIAGKTFYNNQQLQLKAKILPEGAYADVEWKVKATSYVLAVDDSGLVTFKSTISKPGDNTTVVATVKGTNISDELSFQKCVYISASVPWDATYRPLSEGTVNTNMGQYDFTDIHWETDDTDIVKITDPTTGKFICLKEGNAVFKVTGTSPDGDTLTYSTTSTIYPHILTGVPGESNRLPGTTYELSSTLVGLKNGENGTVTLDDVTFVSTNPDVASFEGNVLTLNKPGDTELYAYATIDGSKYQTNTVNFNNVHETDNPVCTVTVQGNTYKFDTIQNAINFIPYSDKGSGVINLLKDVTVDDRININNRIITLNLGDYTITSTIPEKDITTKISAIQITGGSVITVNANNGGVKSEGVYCFNLSTGDTTKLIINGGNYVGYTTCVQVNNGSAEINGGNYTSSNDYAEYLINCINEDYKSGHADIIVKGGTFKDFDPYNNTAEGPSTNYVAKGYKSTTESGVTTVSPREATTAISFREYETVKSSDAQTAGIRFIFEASTTDPDKINAYGAYILPLDMFNDSDYSSQAVNAKYNGQIENFNTFTADILDIPSSSFNTKILAIPYYIQDGESTVYLDEKVSVSVN